MWVVYRNKEPSEGQKSDYISQLTW